MLQVYQTKNKRLLKKILNKDFLTQILPDDELELIALGRINSILSGSNWLVMEDDEKKEIYGVLRWNYVSSITASVHAYLLPEFWGSGVSDELNKKVDEWFCSDTFIHKLTVFSPAACTHVLKAVSRLGYEIEGVMVDAVVWRRNVTNLVVMSKFI